MNINSFHKLTATKLYQIDNNNSCYEVSISTLILPFVLRYNKKLKKGSCSNCGYSFLVNTTNISSPIGNIQASIFTSPL